MSRFGFHPIIEQWFATKFAGPTEPQERGWPEIAAGRHTLIAAPTGSGKTLTAFLAVIDRLVREGLAGTLKSEMRVVYLSPLRALSNDMQKNLSGPLEEIVAEATLAGIALSPIRVGLRTGDTSASDRAKLVKNPPHILVTTPESLFLLLTAEKGRAALSTVDTVIVDEIHALARDKRGSHLVLSLERLEHLVQQHQGESEPLTTFRRLQRIGLSATQKPIDRMARFLVGAGDAPLPVPAEPPAREKPPECEGPGCHEEVDRAGQISRREQPPPIEVDCAIVDVGHQRELDLAIETPESELGAVCSHELWAEVNARMVELIQTHRSTLIFVNTRRMAERVTFQLTELLGEDAVSSHHGSLSAPIRLKTEQRLKSGELKAVVATASLELGIDIGFVDLVIQLGSPRSIATFLQRIGRSGHALGLIPRGRLFALTRDELLEAMGLIRAIRAGRLDVTPIPTAPLDILAQQIVAEVSTGEWNTDDLYDRFRRAEPYRTLRRSQFDQVIKFISEGVTDTGGRVHVLLHHDHVQKRLRARPAARLTTINNGGAIPETDVIRVVVQPEGTVVGSVDEEFGIESQCGDVFLLGNTSWQIEGLRGSDLNVHDAHGAPPTIPFWRGEGPGRTIELSEEVSLVRREIEERVKMALGGQTFAAGICDAEEDSPRSHGGTEKKEEEETSAHRQEISGELGERASCREAVFGLYSLSPGIDQDHSLSTTAGERAGVRGLSRDERQEAKGESPAVAARIPDSSLRSSRSVPPYLGDESSSEEPAPSAVPLTRAFERIAQWLVETTHCTLSAAQQMVTYVAAQQAAVGLVPTQDRVIFERFFDETGGMQLVVHAPFGARINRAWGLAMRKRFCRSFDFELQATADDDGFILSLGPQHSFPIESLFPMLRADNAQNLLEQAILAVPMFQLRWRWNATRALLVARQKNGKKVPPALQRFRSDDLLTAVFPRLTGCQENIVGDHVLPDHPLVEQTMYDCLNEALDIEGLLALLARVERGEIEFIARDTREPSPFSYELLNANPYAFLDGGEAQERRARAVQTRRSLSVNDVRDLGRLNPDAIEQVVSESRPIVRNADELHDVLLSRIVLPIPSDKSWCRYFEELRSAGRAATITLPNGAGSWVAAERWPAAKLVYATAVCDPPLSVPSTVRQDWEEIEALVAVIRGGVEYSGPVTAEELAAEMSLSVSQVFSSLEALEGDGTVLRGRFRPSLSESGGVSSRRDPDTKLDGLEASALPLTVEWCHRRLLARIHRLTVAGLRKEIEPVDVATFVRYLTRHQMLWPDARRTGSNALYDVISQLQGIDISAAAWEADILPLRVADFKREWLDELSLTGEVTWGRLYPPARDPDKSRPNAILTRVAPVSICLREDLPWLLSTAGETTLESLGSQAREIVQILCQRGAVFATDLLHDCRMLPSQLDDVLGELVTRGWVTADGFSGLRSLIRDGESEADRSRSGRGPKVVRNRRNTTVGRWTLWRKVEGGTESCPEVATSGSVSDPIARDVVEQWAWQLLRRWGVIFRDLINREPGAPRWWELLQVYRRLEARGEIRGGRFIAGVAGEQFALGDTIREIRQLKEQPSVGELVIVSACDPLNLIGILNNEARVPSQPANRVALFNGTAVAVFQGEVQLLPTCPKSLAPFISAQLRCGKTMAVAIPKSTTKTSTPSSPSQISLTVTGATDLPLQDVVPVAAVPAGPKQPPLTPVERFLSKRRPAPKPANKIPRPRIS